MNANEKTTTTMNNNNNNSSNSQISWADKQITLQQVANKIPNGSAVYIGSTAATAEAALQALVDDPRLADIQIIQLIPGGCLPHLKERLDRFRTSSFYSFSIRGSYFKANDRAGSEGLQDYTPASITSVPRLLQEQKLRVNVAMIKCTRPHKGFVSLGMGVELTKVFVQHAQLVIAEVNDHMPWTEGRSKLAIREIDYWIDKDQPLLTTPELWPFFYQQAFYSEDVLKGIAHHVRKEITHGATLKFGVAPLVLSLIEFLQLEQLHDLGLHTDVLTETLFRLHQLDGVITNIHKTIDTGRSVVSQAHGSQDLYEFIDRNPVIEFQPSSYVCDTQVLAKIDHLVAIVGALKVDLTGQVATDSIAHNFYGGVWSDDESIRGARFSKGGKPIVVLPSKSLHGRSNILSALPPGTGVSITRSDVEYVITEYGTASLYGKSIRERCLALIDIAHPDFRAELLGQAKASHYISSSQPGKSFGSVYPAELEEEWKTKTGKQVIVRPIKAVDEDNLRNFFHQLSDHSVYLRYFRKMKSMPQKILQKTADVDYSKDMALVVLSPPDPFQHEIVGIAQWCSDPRGIDSVPDIAFQVRDDWQGEGLGTYLFQRLVQIAKVVGLSKFKADVLSQNKEMNAIFQNSGVPFVRRTDFGVITYLFDLESDKTEASP
jgi:acyl-CoA hydrolase/GNAT superfamily N-acetyltransferase